ncbi:MAG: transcription elongation factor GreA [Candidatus Dormibacteraceae bacterium]
MPPQIDITPEGLVAVRAELQELTSVRRPNIVDKIKAARELGDLSENFEYHSAKNEQGFIESRIAELEAIVRDHRIIEAPKPSGIVQMGSTVRFSEDGGPEEHYRIVGPAEADPMAGRVSNESAIGRSLLGKKVGDIAEVVTESGESYSIKVLAVE